MWSKCRATVGNGFEPASSELRDATRYIVNQPLGNNPGDAIANV